MSARAGTARRPPGPRLATMGRLVAEPLLGPRAAAYLPLLTDQELRQLAYLLDAGEAAAARTFWLLLRDGVRGRAPAPRAHQSPRRPAA